MPIFLGVSGRIRSGKHGEEHLLGVDDILIVAPYNAQVSALLNQLPEGSRVGTVPFLLFTPGL